MKSQDVSFVEKELKILRHRSLKSHEKSKERDKNYENKIPTGGERNYRVRSRERNFERRRSLDKMKDRERNKRSRDRSWDKNDGDKWRSNYKRDKDDRFKYDKDTRDSKMRKFSPSRDAYVILYNLVL